MPTRRFSGTATAASDPDNGGDHSGGGGGTYVDDVFSTYLYDGKGADQDIVNGIDLAGEGGLVWVKARTGNYSHSLQDTENGLGYLMSNDTAGISVNPNGLKSYNFDGFTWGTHMFGEDIVSWTFRKAKNFFDVVTYTGDGVAGREIPHNLGVEPGMIIIKNTSESADWAVWHRDTQYGGKLNKTEAFGYVFVSSASESGFTISYGNLESNSDGKDYVAYVFAHDDSDESMIKCGSYTGTGVAGNEIDLGWEPQWVMVKSSTAADKWTMYDTMRGIVTGDNGYRLWANESSAESGYNNSIDVTSTGFKKMSALSNESGESYIYMAIRRPNKPADEFEADELFAVAYSQNQEPDPSFVSGFPVDLGMYTRPVSSYSNIFIPRLTDAILVSESSAVEYDASAGFDYMNGYISQDWQGHNPAFLSWMWRRAPGFFDVVNPNNKSYKPATDTHNHSLGVPPELIIAKCRDFDQEWYVGVQADQTGDNFYQLNLNSSAAGFVSNAYFKWGNHTDSTFYSALYGTSAGYIHYLFASVPGISKVGSYTGGGSNQVTVRCGFTTGVKFLLVKCASSNGDWAVWDAERGFTASWNSNPYIKLNSTEAQTPGSDQSPTNVSWGFVFAGSSSPRTFNALGEEYIYYAIAN